MASYKEKARAAFLEQVHAKGFCDSREVAFGANADRLPNGAFGMVLLALRDNTLRICDLDIKSNIGPVLYTIPLAEVEQFRVGLGLVGRSLRFTWQGQMFSFKNMVGLKEQLELLAAEANR